MIVTIMIMVVTIRAMVMTVMIGVHPLRAQKAQSRMSVTWALNLYKCWAWQKIGKSFAMMTSPGVNGRWQVP